MLIFRSRKKTENLVSAASAALVCLLFFVLGSSVARAQTVNTRAGETFTVSLTAGSSYQNWELDSYDENFVELENSERSDAEQQVEFIFRAVTAGTTQLVFEKSIRTALVDRRQGSDTYQVIIEADRTTSESEAESEFEPQSPSLETDYSASDRADTDSGSQLDRDDWAMVNEFIELEKFDAARETIREKIDEYSEDGRQSSSQDNSNKLKRRWLTKLAESFEQAEEYEQAIETWQRLTEEFPEGPVARWLYSIAQNYRKLNDDDQAELVLLRIRHRHRDSPVWTKAMEMLGRIAIENGEMERARQLLEKAEQVYRSGDRPGLLLKLAEVYDRYEAVRDYAKAVRFYRRAADRLEDSQPDKAEKARRRARYLENNFVDFGAER